MDGVLADSLLVDGLLMDSVALALADPIRRQILRMLRDRPTTAGDIAEAFPVSRPAVSRHLRVLREASLVRDTARGRERTYHLELRGLAGLESYVRELHAPPRPERAQPDWERRFDALDTEVHRVRRSNRARAKEKPQPRKKTA